MLIKHKINIMTPLNPQDEQENTGHEAPGNIEKELIERLCSRVGLSGVEKIDNSGGADIWSAVAVRKNTRDAEGRPTGETSIEDGWSIYGFGKKENDGVEMAVVVKYGTSGELVAAKSYTMSALNEIQEQYNREIGLFINPDSGQYSLDRHDIRALKNMAASVVVEDMPDGRFELFGEVLSQGTIKGESVVWSEVAKDAAGCVDMRRFFAAMIEMSPETAKTARLIAEKKVGGMHFTRSAALDGILRHEGLVATKTLRQSGDPVVTGEHIYQRAHGQDDISFSNFSSLGPTMDAYVGKIEWKQSSLESAIAKIQDEIGELTKMLHEPGLAEQVRGHLEYFIQGKRSVLESVHKNPDTLLAWANMNDFPIAFGISIPFIEEGEEHRTNNRRLNTGVSYYGEFRPAVSKIPIEGGLPVMAVPEVLVQTMQTYMRECGYAELAVVPIEHFKEAADHMYDDLNKL